KEKGFILKILFKAKTKNSSHVGVLLKQGNTHKLCLIHSFANVLLLKIAFLLEILVHLGFGTGWCNPIVNLLAYSSTQNVVLDEEDDKHIWRHTASGTFSSKSCYRTFF
ncbi:hypothetical protein ACJX0J_014291, partial [Zea mays]